MECDEESTGECCSPPGVRHRSPNWLPNDLSVEKTLFCLTRKFSMNLALPSSAEILLISSGSLAAGASSAKYCSLEIMIGIFSSLLHLHRLTIRPPIWEREQDELGRSV